jgi:hypothetical protein
VAHNNQQKQTTMNHKQQNKADTHTKHNKHTQPTTTTTTHTPQTTSTQQQLLTTTKTFCYHATYSIFSSGTCQLTTPESRNASRAAWEHTSPKSHTSASAVHPANGTSACGFYGFPIDITVPNTQRHFAIAKDHDPQTHHHQW